MQAEELEATDVTTPPAPLVSFTCSCVEAKDLKQKERMSRRWELLCDETVVPGELELMEEKD